MEMESRIADPSAEDPDPIIEKRPESGSDPQKIIKSNTIITLKINI